MAWVAFMNWQDFMSTRFWKLKNKLFKKDSNADFGWPTFFVIFVFFNDGNMVSLFCFDLVLNKAKADLYNYELKVWKIIRNADLKYNLTPFIESKDTCHLHSMATANLNKS